jgi:uncharacterized protein YciI
METKHFLYRLYPSRPSFNSDQNESEKEIMQQHIEYWKDLANRKNAIVYGPVFDPKGVYGIAVIEVNNEEEAEEIAKNDPAVLFKICTCELMPMQVAMAR